jgi:hypothetical protein
VLLAIAINSVVEGKSANQEAVELDFAVPLIVDPIHLPAGGSEANRGAKDQLLEELKFELGRHGYERGCLLLPCVIKLVGASNERQAGLLPAGIRLSSSPLLFSKLWSS